MGQDLSTEELIRRCVSSDSSAAWEEFVRRFQPVITQTVLRTASRLGDSSSSTVTDLVQETYLKLCANNFRLLRTFQPAYPDAFFGFVRTVAANLVRDHFRAIHAQCRGSQQPVSAESPEHLAAPTSAPGNHAHLHREVLLREIDAHLADAFDGPNALRNRHIFWLYYRAGCSAAEIAALPGLDLTAKGVESLLFRMTRELRSRMSHPPQLSSAPESATG
ncbi:MAG: sigma-70 family RNA polymerase sigma factor [Terracidiphilus sp.]|nr:sigma-70 family RNA polymerase sigma factor [Terracidiphilus sp.]